MAFKFDANLDASGFKRGSEQMADALDNTVDTFKDLERQGERSIDNLSDGLGDGIKGGTREAENAVEKLEKKIRSSLDAAEDSAKRTGNGIGDSVKRGSREAEDGLDTMSENAASNAKEIGASFDGSFEGMVDGIQGFVAEALEGFGALGIAAGVAFAATIGIGLQALQSAADEANELTDTAISFGDALAQASTEEEAVAVLRDRFEEVANAVGDARSVWEIWQTRARTQGEQLADAIKLGALSAVDLSDAFDDPNPVTRMESLRKVQDQLNASIAQSTDEYEKAANGQLIAKDAVENWVDANADAAAVAKENLDISQEAKGILDEEIATQEAAVAILEAKATALGMTTEEYQASQAETERATEVQEGFNSALESAGDSVSVYEGILQRKTEAEKTAAQATADSTKDTTDSWEDYADTVSVSVDDMISEWNRQAEAAESFEANLALIAANGGQALADELRAKGPEAAGATADLLAKASPDQQRQAFESWGRATGQDMGDAMGEGVKSSQPKVQSDVDLLRQGIRTPAPVPLGVELPTQEQLQLELDRKVRALRPGTIELPAIVGVQRAV